MNIQHSTTNECYKCSYIETVPDKDGGNGYSGGGADYDEKS